MCANAKYDMQREGVTPNTLIVPPRMGIFCAWNDQRTSYKESGPRGDKILYGGELSIPRIVGCDVFEAQSFDTSFSSQPINQCCRVRQCGEFWWIPEINAEEGRRQATLTMKFKFIRPKQIAFRTLKLPN